MLPAPSRRQKAARLEAVHVYEFTSMASALTFQNGQFVCQRSAWDSQEGIFKGVRLPQIECGGEEMGSHSEDL